MKSELQKEIKQEADAIIEEIADTCISANQDTLSINSLIAKTDFTDSVIKRIAKLKVKVMVYNTLWGE